MGLANSIGATTDRAVGAAKDRLGAATGNAELQAQGLAQNAVGRAGGHGQDVEGAARDIVEDQERPAPLQHDCPAERIRHHKPQVRTGTRPIPPPWTRPAGRARPLPRR
ncbi:CsbD family protein [Kocuria sp. CNJ-770]|uniref:CsbD family protein n=1 Tax=Kocuria sp. CNJ-770 TaxID=1904964 RepID=UPI0016519F3E|nr:CsbD family protein [Kocuria sp. CNJ-770]